MTRRKTRAQKLAADIARYRDRLATALALARSDGLARLRAAHRLPPKA